MSPHPVWSQCTKYDTFDTKWVWQVFVGTKVQQQYLYTCIILAVNVGIMLGISMQCLFVQVLTSKEKGDKIDVVGAVLGRKKLSTSTVLEFFVLMSLSRSPQRLVSVYVYVSRRDRRGACTACNACTGPLGCKSTDSLGDANVSVTNPEVHLGFRPRSAAVGKYVTRSRACISPPPTRTLSSFTLGNVLREGFTR